MCIGTVSCCGSCQSQYCSQYQYAPSSIAPYDYSYDTSSSSETDTLNGMHDE